MKLSQPEWEYVRERSKYFTGRTWVFDELRRFLDGPVGRFVIKGPPGTGKTAIAAQLIQASTATASPTADASEVSYAARVFPPETVHAVYLCRAGQVDILDCAQRLSEQLCDAVEGFEETLRAFLAPQITTGEVRVETGDVAAGASVIGIRISLGALGPERAVTQGVNIPLKRLREKGFSERIVILIDALDEAMTSDATRDLNRLMADIEGSHLIISTRPDRDVLGQWQDSAQILDLIGDAPDDTNDLADYVSARLTAVQDQQAKSALATLIAGRAEGNFLYALYVLDSLMKDRALDDLNSVEVERLDLPTGGLPGVYRRFLQREPAAWSSRYYPILAPLIVGQGNGLDTDQLIPFAKYISGESFSRTKVRQVTRNISQFLEGKFPDGPFRPYHKSFADFLQDPDENPDFTIDASEGHAAIVETYLQKERSEWDDYAWRYLFVHAYEAGKGDASFEHLFKLAEDDYLAEKLTHLARFEDVSADYELLFEACTTRQEVGRSAVYALMRSAVTKRGSVLETPGLIGLLLADPDLEKTGRTFTELCSLAELVLDPVHKAAVLINLYEQCPEWLATSDEGKGIQDAAGRLLQQVPISDARNYQITRLAKAASVQRHDQLEWVETLLANLSSSGYLSEGWAILAQGYQRWGDEENSVRCLKETLRHWYTSNIFSVARLFEACEGLKEPTSFKQLNEKAREVGAAWTGNNKQAELCTIAAGLLARAGDEAQAVQQIEPGFRLFAESQEKEWQRALFISMVAAALREFRDPESITHLWAKYLTALKSLSGSSAKRLAARLVISLADHVRHGAVAAETALQDVAALNSFELDDYGCCAELAQLIEACITSESLTALRVFQEKLDQMEPARDRARLSARLIIAFDALGDTQAALKLFDEAEQAYLSSKSQDRIGGGIALAAAPGAEAHVGLLVGIDFSDLQTLNDSFDRMRGLSQILETLQSFSDFPDVASIIRMAIAEIRIMENREQLLSTAAKTATALLQPLAQRQVADDISFALNASKNSVGIMSSKALAARAFQLSGNSELAKSVLGQSLQTYRVAIDERTKWQAGRELARSCAALEDRETLGSLFEITRQFGAKDFTGRFYREVAGALVPPHFDNLLEEEAEKLLDLVGSLSHQVSQAELLGNVARGLSSTTATERNLKLLERIAEGLDRIPPPLEMRDATETETSLNAWANVSRTLAVWGIEQEKFASMPNALDWWCRFVGLATSRDGWYRRIGDFAEALVSSPDKIRKISLQAAFDESRNNPSCLLKLIQALCEATEDELAGERTEEVVTLCNQELHRVKLDRQEQFEGISNNPELAYSCVLAFSRLAAAHDRSPHHSEGKDWFLIALGVAAQIEYDQMKVWSYRALLERCSISSPIRTRIEQDAIRLLPTLGDMQNRSDIAKAWLRTTKVKDYSRAMGLFKYVKPDGSRIGDLSETIIAFLQNGDNFSKMSTLAFRAAALFSEEQVLYVSAWVALEQAKRSVRIDDKLISLLDSGLELNVA